MPKPRLHLDADTSIRQLQRALIDRGHDVTRTPNDWITLDADDEAQLQKLIETGAGVVEQRQQLAELTAALKIEEEISCMTVSKPVDTVCTDLIEFALESFIDGTQKHSWDRVVAAEKLGYTLSLRTTSSSCRISVHRVLYRKQEKAQTLNVSNTLTKYLRLSWLHCVFCCYRYHYCTVVQTLPLVSTMQHFSYVALFLTGSCKFNLPLPVPS